MKSIVILLAGLFFNLSSIFSQELVLRNPVKITPENIFEGAEITFEAVVEAKVNLTTPMSVLCGIDGKVVYTQMVERLRQNQTQTIKFTWKAIGGDHKAFFKVQPSNQPNIKSVPDNRSISASRMQSVVKEFSVAKFELAQKKVGLSYKTSKTPQPSQPEEEVLPPCENIPLPDLVVKVGDANGSGYLNENVSISVDVINVGQCYSASCKLKLFVNTSDPWKLVGEVNIPVLQPQSRSGCSDCETTVYFDYIPTKVGNYQFLAVVDVYNRVEEFREDNNDSFGGSFNSIQK